jgi:hypothetical protein
MNKSSERWEKGAKGGVRAKKGQNLERGGVNPGGGGRPNPRRHDGV